jgi:hypothetical protein
MEPGGLGANLSTLLSKFSAPGHTIGSGVKGADVWVALPRFYMCKGSRYGQGSGPTIEQ